MENKNTNNNSILYIKFDDKVVYNKPDDNISDIKTDNKVLYIKVDDKVSYVKTDDNKIINEKCIRWVKKMNDCLEVCTKPTGCSLKVDTHRICEFNNPSSYNKLNKFF